MGQTSMHMQKIVRLDPLIAVDASESFLDMLFTIQRDLFSRENNLALFVRAWNIT
jgi:hypothetical protein